MHIHKSLIGLSFILVSVTCSAQEVYKDAHASIDDRVEDLLKRMTLKEKVEQMSMTGLYDQTQTTSAYGVCESPFVSLKEIAQLSRKAKQHARENTRLGIPPIQIAECLHGLLAYETTIFPQAIAQGSTWNPDLIEQMGKAIAQEARSVGVDQALSPLFDVIRDARYGRNEECYSEDPYLVGSMGSAFVKGMQENGILCTAKHFAGYSQPIAGINLAPASLGEREMRSVHLVPFRMAVEQAHIAAVMPSYNEVDGIPAHANSWLLNDVLRHEWGFQGYTFSDYGSVGHLFNFHRVAGSKEEAAKIAVEAGLDLEASRPDHYVLLEQQVKEGKVDVKTIDQAVRRILRTKFKAGIFDKPYADENDIARNIHTREHIQLAKEIALESIVLLQNEQSLLPLDMKKLKSIAVVGPNANQVQFGDYCWTRDNRYGTTVLEGIQNMAGKNVQVHYAKGCSISGLDKSGIAEAVEAAQKSDVTVAVLGGTSVILSGLGWGKGPGEQEIGDAFTSGEGYDLTDINPLGVQRDLLKALKETGKPIVLVLVHGRPWSIDWEKEHIPAIVEAWYPGEQGGNAIAEILFGNANPSGRLNVSIPRSVGHLPVYYNRKPSALGINKEPGTPDNPGRDYVFSSPDPLFPFGHGLTYTQFEYSDLQVSSNTFGSEGIEISLNVKNTGKRAGKEVVQLYVNDVVSSVTTPDIELKRFKKISLEPGQTERVIFHLSPADLTLWNREMKEVTEPGDFELMVGKSSSDIQLRKRVTYNL